MTDILIYFLLLVCGLLLGLLIPRLLKQAPARQSETGSGSRDVSRLSQELHTLNGRVDGLSKQVMPTGNTVNERERINKLDQRLAFLEAEFQKIRDRPQPPVPPPPAAGISTSPQVVSTLATPKPPLSEPTVSKPPALNPAPTAPVAAAISLTKEEPTMDYPVRYARTPDLGDGFSLENLADDLTRPMVFVIRQTSPTTATFSVLDSPDAQQLALSDPFSYLKDACEYRAQPGQYSRIQTDAPGRLSLQDRKWRIDEKARINFS
jgi:hypothetical protein